VAWGVCGPAVAAAPLFTFEQVGRGRDARAISADGTTVVGLNARWTAATGWRDLGALPGTSDTRGNARAVSADGSIVAGTGINAKQTGEPYRWTASTGKVGLGLPPDEISANASGISADGTVVAISANFAKFRWTAQSGFVALAHLGAPGYQSVAAISADGTTIVGDDLVNGVRTAVRWSADGRETLLSVGTALAASADAAVIVGTTAWAQTSSAPVIWRNGEVLKLTDIDTPAGRMAVVRGQAQAVSADGQIVVGFYVTSQTPEAFIWDPLNGMRDLATLLRDGGADVTGKLAAPTDSNPYNMGPLGISADGTRILGNGELNGPRTWIATIPEPASIAYVGGMALSLLLCRRRMVPSPCHPRPNRYTVRFVKP
jgi:probable HAF family extracellular repeat protein